MRLGFACHWDPEPQGTWSGTPWRFREALARHVTVGDVGLSLPAATRAALKVTHARYRHGQWSSTWKHSPATDALREALLRTRTRRGEYDAVLEIQDLAILDRPFFLYQDLSYDALLRHLGDGLSAHQFPGLSPRLIERRRARQQRVYEASAGILAMSEWFAETLVKWSGVPAAKVFAVPPGVNATGGAGGTDHAAGAARPDAAPAGRGPALLFLGKDFHRKGGDLAVAATATLRRDYHPELTLTVAGPQTWPLAAPPPDGVRFLGPVPSDAVTALMDAHDLLVLPSRFEAFGIVFVEALSRGLPCVARDAFAMPEIIRPGRNGALIPGPEERPDVLAEAIVRVLDDAGIRRRCAQERAAVRAHYSWDRAAAATVAIIEGALAGRVPPA